MLSRCVALSLRGPIHTRYTARIPVRSYAKHNKPPSHQNQSPANRHGNNPRRNQEAATVSRLDSISAKIHQSQERLGHQRNEAIQSKKILAAHPQQSQTPISHKISLPQEEAIHDIDAKDTDTVQQPPVSNSDAPYLQQEAGEPASTRPLPDLTQGIPSTLDAELDARSEKADIRSLNITEDPQVSEGKRELPKTAYISSVERKQKRLSRILYAILLANALGATIWLGRNWENEEEEKKHPDAPSGWGPILFYKRARARLGETLDFYTEPTFPKLLPPPDKAWARPYTLVLSLEDLLIHNEWTREHGWRIAKRPGMDYFLRYLSSYYELVIWTSRPAMEAQPVIQKLDPYRIVLWPLFREATRYQDGGYIKDLDFLNRDPSKVIILDTDPSCTRNQPDNAIIIPPWKSDPNNKELVNLIPFLEYCATMNFSDLRSVLKAFHGTDIPREYARREALMKEKHQKEMSDQLRRHRKSGVGVMSALTGPSQSQLIGPDGTPLPTLSDAMAQGKTYMDYVRERGQKQYEMLEKQIQENGAMWLKEMEAEEKKMNEEAMDGMKKSARSWIPFVGRAKEDEEKKKG